MSMSDFSGLMQQALQDLRSAQIQCRTAKGFLGRGKDHAIDLASRVGGSSDARALVEASISLSNAERLAAQAEEALQQACGDVNGWGQANQLW
jgi:hypothetical protein